MTYNKTFQQVKQASRQLALLPDAIRSKVISDLAEAMLRQTDRLLAANLNDLKAMPPDHPLHDRLLLTPERLADIAKGLREVAAMPSPLGITRQERQLDNGLRLRRVSVPFGVIGIIYEARPNVTYDVFALCMKSGNAPIMKGGRDADHSNRAAIDLIKDVLRQNGLHSHTAELLPATHEATAGLLNAVGYVDLCIPRGGKQLIQMVRDNARVPVIETGAGVVHAYLDDSADLQMGTRIVLNAKTRRPSVCNTLDTLLVHRHRLADLPQLCKPLRAYRVELYADAEALETLRGNYPEPLLHSAGEDTYDTEWMAYKMGIRTVSGLDEALEHITLHGSGHSECIITGCDDHARRFQQEVDAACIYVNAPTSFTDGAQFGLGAEIGISTQKLGPRGPMGLEELTTYKWLINGNGQTRP